METCSRLHSGLIALGALVLNSCTTTAPVHNTASAPAAETASASLAEPVAPLDLPGWPGGNGVAGLEALYASCQAWQVLDPDTPVSRKVEYAGRAGDWMPVCDALAVAATPDRAWQVVAENLVPLEILPDERNRFTGYFEPEITARHTPVTPYTEPVPGIPADLDLSDPENPRQRFPDGRLAPYPPRAAIDVASLPVLGYAHPADVFFLQIQGSGRLRFEDGEVVRAAFAAHNGQPFRGIGNWLIAEGEIPRGEAGMGGIRAWMDRAAPERVREAMNVNPRFVFFRPLPIGDPEAGPEGAMGVALTPLGSLAVDTDFHPLGVPLYVETDLPPPGAMGGGPFPFRGLFVAQDTGGAIRGPVRGDIFFGTGDIAGAYAGRMNAPGRMWVLLPAPVAHRLYAADVAAGKVP